MSKDRIAVLFDAENFACDAARQILAAIAARGTVLIRKAVGDFSSPGLAHWVNYCSDAGIELILQPNLGKGKNSADIRLAIEAIEIAHQRSINTVALVTRDRDFTPLAHRLRHMGLAVLGYAESEPSLAFRAACSSFEIIGRPETVVRLTPAPAPVKPKPVTQPTAARPVFSKDELQRLHTVVAGASTGGPVASSALSAALRKAEPGLHQRLGGLGKFQKSLVALGLVSIVGSGAKQRLQAPAREHAA